jgi:integral membrane protein (TIGR01906 family)
MLKKILIISLFLLIILSNFRFFIFNENFYLAESEKLNTQQHKDKYLNIINYLKNNEPLRYFNEKEVLHMEDVKNLIQKTIYLLYISFISTIILSFYFIYKKQHKIIILSLKKSSILIIIFSSLLTILSLISFNKTFIYFHKIFFTNDLWILNPEKDLLINLFPQKFFIDFMKKLIINSYIASVIILLFTTLTKTLKKKKLLI